MKTKEELQVELDRLKIMKFDLDVLINTCTDQRESVLNRILTVSQEIEKIKEKN